MYSLSDGAVPEPLRAGLRGVSQVFFQENALTGALRPRHPAQFANDGVGRGRWFRDWHSDGVLKFDKAELSDGIYGFNSTLVGIATLFFFRPGVVSTVLLVVGCVVAAIVTWLARRYVPFPTYTRPFIVTTWGLFFLGLATGAARVEPGPPLGSVGFVGAALHGVSQVMFQASYWTALLFLIGIGLIDWQHASWVLLGSVIGMLLGNYHDGSNATGLDPESLVDCALTENVALGLYSYNATLAAVALSLWRLSLIPPLLGIRPSVPLTELLPMLGLPALTAPFVLATWIVLSFLWLDGRLFREKVAPAS